MGARTEPLRVYMSRPCWNERGGPTGHLPFLIDGLDARPDVSLVTFVYGSRRFAGVPRWLSDSLPGRVATVAWDLSRFLGLVLRRGRPDVLHLNSSYEPWAVLRDLPYLLAGRVLGFAVIVKTHGSDEAFAGNTAPPWRQVKGLHRRLATVMTLLSPVETEQFREAHPGERGTFRTGKNIVKAAPTPAAAREPGNVLFAGRLVEKKDVPTLLRALEVLGAERPDLSLTVAGVGPLEPELRGLAEELGVADRIRWAGWLPRPELRRLVASTSAVAFTSTGSEGMPMVVIESLAAGVRLVSTPVRFVRSHGLDGMGVAVVEAGDVHGLAAALRDALDAPSLDTQELTERERFLDGFRQDVVVDEFVELYREARCSRGA